MIVQIVATRDDLAEIILNITTSSSTRSQILVRGQCNLIETTFTKLHMLYLQQSITITKESMIGQLLSAKESTDNMCGATIPMSVLTYLCEVALSLSDIISFLQVCKCYHSDLYFFPGAVLDAASRDRLVQINCNKNVELNGNAMWSLMILSEMLGVRKVHRECKLRLIRMMTPSSRCTSDKNMGQLPVSLLKGVPMMEDELQMMERQLFAHFLQYGPLASEQLNSANQVTPVRVYERPHTPNSAYSVMTNNMENSSKTESSSISHHMTPNTFVQYGPLQTANKITTQQKILRQNFHSAGDESYHSAVVHPDLINQQMLYCTPFNSLKGGSEHKPESSQWYDNTPSSAGTADTDISGSTQPPPYQMPPAVSPDDLRNQFNDPDIQLNTSEKKLSHHPYQRQIHTRAGVVAESDDATTTSYDSWYEESDQLRMSTVNESVADDTKTFPYTKAFDDQSDHQISYRQDKTRAARSKGDDRNRNGQNATTVAFGRSSTTPTRQGGKIAGTSNRKAASEQEVGSGNSNGRSPKNSLSAEDLKLSREVALLRLKEVKVKEELEVSKRMADEAVRESRLRSLELKAAVARLSNRGNKNSSTAQHSSRSNNNGMVKVRRSISAPHSDEFHCEMRGKKVHFEENDRYIAEDGRRRAMMRVKEARQKMIRKEEELRRQEQIERSKKWEKRDEQIARFKEKQAIKGRISSISPEDSRHTMVVVDKKDVMNRRQSASMTGIRQQQLLGIESDDDTQLNGRDSSKPCNAHFSKSDSAVDRKCHKQQIQRKGQERKIRSSDDARGDELRHSGGYTQEALRAVGLGYSPSSSLSKASTKGSKHHGLTSPKIENSESFLRREHQLLNQASRQSTERKLSSALHSEGSSRISGSTNDIDPPEIISIRVLRAWGLSECLGGTTSYIVFDWGKWGRACTQAISNTTEPHFGATLQFKSPYLPVNDALMVKGNCQGSILNTQNYGPLLSRAGQMRVLVYNRNQSVSDELLGYGEVDIHEQLLQVLNRGCDTTQPVDISDIAMDRAAILHLSGPTKRAAGCVEFIVRFMS